MNAGDLGRVLEIAGSLPHAPRWPVSAYVAAINPENTPRRIALVAEENGVVAGFLVARLLPPEAELETIAVAAGAQGRGVGGMLLDALFTALRNDGVMELKLEVRASNQTALRLYRGRGFEEAGRRVRYYADPEEDAVLMELRLT